MKPFDLNQIVRPNILALTPYSCARDEFKGEASIFLDANESPYDTGLNRYPDPMQMQLKQRVSALKSVPEEQIFFGNGSDEAIDLVYRIFCRPGHDNVVAPSPTYGMYAVAAEINDVEYRSVALNPDFSLDVEQILAAIDERTKVLWLCSPNNPTGNLLSRTALTEILERFTQGVVVIDEAYIDFVASTPEAVADHSWCRMLGQYKQLIVLQTFSKAWGLAGVRVGMAFASSDIISLFNRVKYPYNLSVLAQQQALLRLDEAAEVYAEVQTIVSERQSLARELAAIPGVYNVYPSDANFLLVKVSDADALYTRLCDEGIIVRNRNRVTLCHGCLRISIGTPSQNRLLLVALRRFLAEA